MDTTAGGQPMMPSDAADARDRTWSAALAVIVVAVLAELALLVLLPVFVTTDGAAHVDGARELARLAFGVGPSLSYTTIGWLPATNLLPEVPMAVLAAAVGGPAAEKLVLAAWVVLLPVALWYGITGVRRGAAWLTVVALPLTFGLILQLGFYSFCFATLLFLVVAGYHARHRDRPNGRSVATLAVLITLTYMAHAFVFGVAVALLGVLEAWTWVVDGPRTAGGLGRRLGRVLATAIPALALIALALVAGPGKAPGAPEAADVPLIAFQVRAFLESVLLILQVAVFDQREALPALLLSGLLIVMAAIAVLARRGARPLRAVDGYLVFVGLLLVAILLVPDSATLGAGGPGAFVTSRLAVFVGFGGILWLAAHPFGPRIRWATIAVAVVASLGLLAIRMPWYLRLSDQAAAFASLAPCVGPGATMAQVNLSRFELPSHRTDQIENETGRLSAVTGGLDLGDAELGDRVHLVRYRDDVDPYRHLRGAGGLPATVDPVIDPDRYARDSGGSLDYVLVFGRPQATPEVLASPEWTRLSDQLASGYRRVAVVDDGRVELYERQGTDAAAAGEDLRAASAFCQTIVGD